ncbi:MAG TPA: hypothetical protein VKE51_41335 [Vicinamibacterales bacterium]|nr:hypothetical protein [Vicinamibacterales bacterium]
MLNILLKSSQADLQNFVRKSRKPILQNCGSDRASEVDRGSHESSE